MNKTYLIYGISKGLGKAITSNLPDKSDFVYGISRSRPDYLDQNNNIKWIPADLSDSLAATRMIRKSIGKAKIDYLIYNIGIWEKKAFNDDY